MNFLEKRILTDGKIYPGNVLKVDSFLNHQMDIALFQQIGRAFRRRFADAPIDKILTIEASGIGISCITAQYFHVPVIFAKKAKTSNISGNVYVSEVTSYTHQCVNQVLLSKEFLHPGERVLIIDDFLARGSAVRCMLDILHQAGSVPVGVGIVVEKGFQPGGEELRRDGYRLESLSIIDDMNSETGEVIFRKQKRKGVLREK